METTRLGREDWLRAARLVLLTGGPAAVRIEPLAEQLGVTKGSFYWHFADRGALLEALVREWEEELTVALRELPRTRGAEGVREIMHFIRPRVVASERGEAPSDAAIFAWASGDPRVARRVQVAEERRIAFFQELVEDPELGEFLYLAYLGFVTRRRRVPAASAFFASLAQLSEQIVERMQDRRRRTAEPARTPGERARGKGVSRPARSGVPSVKGRRHDDR